MRIQPSIPGPESVGVDEFAFTSPDFPNTREPCHLDRFLARGFEPMPFFMSIRLKSLKPFPINS
jgi:hypothetical protein